MIRVQDKPINSIKKQKRRVERELEKETIEVREPLIGRVCYGHCSGCDDYSIQKVYKLYTECRSCGFHYHFSQIKNPLMPLLMI